MNTEPIARRDINLASSWSTKDLILEFRTKGHKVSVQAFTLTCHQPNQSKHTFVLAHLASGNLVLNHQNIFTVYRMFLSTRFWDCKDNILHVVLVVWLSQCNDQLGNS